MAKELFSVIERVDCRRLILRGTGENKADVGMAKIGRKVNLRDSDRPHARVGHFVGDQLFQLFADAFRDALCAVRIQISEYRKRSRKRHVG